MFKKRSCEIGLVVMCETGKRNENRNNKLKVLREKHKLVLFHLIQMKKGMKKRMKKRMKKKTTKRKTKMNNHKNQRIKR